MYTIADLKEYLDQYDDSLPIVTRADTGCELYDDANLLDLEERLTFEPVSLIITWARAIGEMHSTLKDDEDRLNAPFVEWLMGLPTVNDTIGTL